MAVKFREKALMAYETMPINQKDKVSQIIKLLNINNQQSLKPHKLHKLNGEGLETWVVRVDPTIRLLFTEIDKDFLIIDIIDRAKRDYQ
ncbi:hypothetical protein H6G89_02045 [Oscillatoria sp. FACHB-1407]|uniref:hypothetical protein n=1 Tax=Oscillatoria sp. FACHB-1407 TaxID=2692847 RepID=UPI0016897B99|nr:hypothetical protein [Oscillatoria sp. FACHB-1407]MBD2459814.1 hypothetical protein [Oscillatoria sp. FACHB-1407]